MNSKFAGAIAAGLLIFTTTGLLPAHAATALVDFETTPALPAGPSVFIAAPGPQTIVTAPATFSGGVVLGFATFFPAISFASAPNVYGTANFGNGLAKMLTISIDPAFTTTEVSFALFNGETFSQSYSVSAFNGANLVASQTLANIAPNFNSGYGLVDLASVGGITSVTIAPTNAPAAWDFLIDSVAFNQNIANMAGPNITPPPPPVIQPPAPPVVIMVQADPESEPVEVEVEISFGDDVNDIRGPMLVVNQAVPVPEPETYAMLLAGLGLIGLATRRGLKNTA